MQLIGVGRSALGLDHLRADQVLVGADQADLVPRILQHVLDQIGGRGFAVCAGYAQHDHAVRRVVEPIGRDLRERAAGVLHHYGRRAFGRFLAHDSCRALLECLRDIFMSIGRIAADGDEQVTRLHGAGIISYLADFGIPCCGAFQHRNIFQQLL